uniref:Fibronectin type-III domain-containing protein n=1 Tax=Knipowitschia caucasica TaxID=637954 RepID=A0AAV2KKA8_KNICA
MCGSRRGLLFVKLLQTLVPPLPQTLGLLALDTALMAHQLNASKHYRLLHVPQPRAPHMGAVTAAQEVGNCNPLMPCNWLELTAANGIDIPYVGYVELDVNIFGMVVPQRGILVVKEPFRQQASDGSQPPDLPTPARPGTPLPNEVQLAIKCTSVATQCAMSVIPERSTDDLKVLQQADPAIAPVLAFIQRQCAPGRMEREALDPAARRPAPSNRSPELSETGEWAADGLWVVSREPDVLAHPVQADDPAVWPPAPLAVSSAPGSRVGLLPAPQPGQPGAFTVSDIRADCVTLSWEPPAGEVQNYSVTCSSGEDVVQEVQTEETSVTIRDLRPGQQYLFSVCAQLQRLQSEAAETSTHTIRVCPSSACSSLSSACSSPSSACSSPSSACSSPSSACSSPSSACSSPSSACSSPSSACSSLSSAGSSPSYDTRSEPGQPGAFTVSDIRADCVTLSWEPPAGEVQNYSVTCSSGEDVVQEVQTEETSVTIRDLRPGQQYLFSVCAQLQRLQSEAAETSTHTKPGQPGAFTVSDIRADCVTLSWEPPAGEVQNYSVTCSSGEDVVQEVQTEETSVTIRDLRPGQQYLFSVCAQLQRLQSEAAETSTHTKPGQPGAFTVSDIRADCVTLSWEPPAGEVQNYSVTCSSGEDVVQEVQTEETSVTIRDLRPGQQYLFSVCAQLQRLQSEAAETSTHTKPGQPGAFTVSDIRADCVSLSWEPPAGEVQNYSVTCSSGEDVVQEVQTEETSVTIRDLRPGQQYLFSVCAQLQRLQSEAAETSTHTSK